MSTMTMDFGHTESIKIEYTAARHYTDHPFGDGSVREDHEDIEIQSITFRKVEVVLPEPLLTAAYQYIQRHHDYDEDEL